MPGRDTSIEGLHGFMTAVSGVLALAHIPGPGELGVPHAILEKGQDPPKRAYLGRAEKRRPTSTS